MQLVQESLVSHQRVTHSLKPAMENLSLSSWSCSCNLEPKWAPAPDNSSELVAFAARVITGGNAAVARLTAAPVLGVYLCAPPQQWVLPWPLLSSAAQDGLQVSTTWGLGVSLLVPPLFGVCPSHCRHIYMEKTRVFLGHMWGLMYTRPVCGKTVFVNFFFP